LSKTIEQARKGDRKNDVPVKRRPRRSAEETRRDILAKAEELFRERGFNAVAIADIAAALGMSPANVFKNFNSKNALVDAIGFANESNVTTGTPARVPTLESNTCG